MPWITRADGADAAAAGRTISHCVRDRSVPPTQPDVIWAFVPSLAPGDTEVTEAVYDAAAEPLTEQNYAAVFIPAKQAALVEVEATLQALDDEIVDALIAMGFIRDTPDGDALEALIAGPDQRRHVANYEKQRDEIQQAIANDEAELAAIRVDRAKGVGEMRRRRNRNGLAKA